MRDSYLTDWLARLTLGHVLSESDIATLGRVRQAVQNADKHHRQARDANEVIHRLRYPSEEVLDAVCMAAWNARAIALGDSSARQILGEAVHAAEMEVYDE